ncbi:MAG TPA: 1-phosphofructokinase [Ornithinicoccus sp.]|jgi:1-phosphofructokinase|nr:1-phosphofructokinase [Ornithinicoccus sp.]
MILTVTLNPSLDRTIDVDRIRIGAVHRGLRSRLDPGGKGVNVTRALRANGHRSLAVVPLGGPEGDQLARLLAAERVDVVRVPVEHPTRSNVAVAEADGNVTKFNEPGAPLAPDELRTVLGHVVEHSAAGDWVVLCGSLPPGVPVEQYAAMVTWLRERGRRVAVDTSGEALRLAVQAGPDLVKPNRHELGEVVGRELGTVAEVLDAAHQVHAAGVDHVVVSLGADGALLVGGGGPDLAGTSTVTDAVSSVGAGDAFLAGYLAALTLPDHPAADPDQARERAFRTALAWGAAAVRLPGSRMPGPADIDLAVADVLTSPDPQTPLASA